MQGGWRGTVAEQHGVFGARAARWRHDEFGATPTPGA